MAGAQTIIKGVMGGQVCENVLTWTGPGDFYSDADIQDLAALVASKWATHLIPHLSNKYSTTGVHAVSLDTSYSYDYLASTTGAGTAPPMPVFVVAKVKIATGVRGVQGRTGISGLGNNAV